MTKSEAKSIPIPKLLEKLGHHPDRSRQHGNDLWYRSPFGADENEPSFHVNLAKNIWYDFAPGGKGGGGDIFELVMRLQGCDFASALAFLEQTFAAERGASLVNVRQEKAVETVPAPAFQLLETSAAFAPSLFQFLQKERGINLDQAREFLRQVHFQNAEGRRFFGAGLPNRAGGWEVSNPYFAGCVGPKDISVFPGKSAEAVSVFAGTFDFLSALTWYGKNTLLQTDVLVLHAPALLGHAVEWLRERPECRTLKMYLTNDGAGEETIVGFRRELPDCIIEPCFALYLGFRDFNEFLLDELARRKSAGR